MNFGFYSAYYIDPQTSDVINPDVPHIIPYDKGDLDGEEPHHQWYRPDIAKPTDRSSNSNPKPIAQMTWSDDTKPPASSKSTTLYKSRDFQLFMDLTYRDRKGESVAVVYEGASDDSLKHTILLEDGSKLHIYKSNFQLIDQPALSNLPKTPLDYRNEVGTILTLQEFQSLARPRTLSPLQQDLMSWHQRLYHLTFHIIFHLASMGFLPKRLLEF